MQAMAGRRGIHRCPEQRICRTFALRQWGTKLGGRAWYTETSTDFLGRTTRKTTYGDVGLRRSNMAGNRFTARVQWYNGSIGNYSAYVWFVRRGASGNLYAELKGFTYPESGGALVPFQTYSKPGEARPASCLPADVVG
jgi:hypothetical protein